MLKVSSSLARQVNTAVFEEVIKKKSVTKKVEKNLQVCVFCTIAVITCSYGWYGLTNLSAVFM